MCHNEYLTVKKSNFRLDRLQGVIDILEIASEQTGFSILNSLKKIGDEEGRLMVYWNELPTQDMIENVDSVWALLNEYTTTHFFQHKEIKNGADYTEFYRREIARKKHEKTMEDWM